MKSKDTTSEALAKSVAVPSEYPIDKIRDALIEKRKHNCANIINERKRRLCELYTVAKVPLVAISSERVLQSEGELKMFLEKNDLEKGIEFTITALRREHGEPPRKKMKKDTFVKKANDVESNDQTKTELPRDAKTIGPEKKTSLKENMTPKNSHKTTIDDKKQQKQEVIKTLKENLQKRIELLRKRKTKTIVVRDADHKPTLLEQIERFKKNPSVANTELHSNRDLDWRGMKLEDLLLTLMPARKPHKVAAARSLTELYYHEQTLQLPKLLLRAHKVLTSKSFETSLAEGKVAVLFSRIEELKRCDRWSLRQPRKHADPFLNSGARTFWDNLLREAHWVATDMKQGRRFKAAKCCEVSEEIEAYWRTQNDSKISTESKSDERLSDNSKTLTNDNAKPLDVTDHKVATSADDEHNKMQNDMKGSQSGNKDSNSDRREQEENRSTGMKNIDLTIFKQAPCINPLKTVLHQMKARVLSKPFENSARLSLDIIVEDLPTSGRTVLEKLPLYNPLSTGESKDGGQRIDHAIDRDLFGHVSKLLPPPSGDDEFCWEKLVFRKQSDQHISSRNGKNSTNRPLFGKLSHYNVLRPPRPPSVADIQLRIPTIWLPQDDRLLVRYVTQFSFNWDIIAAHLAPRPTACRYFSNIERRTPWQCFERYIQLNNRFRFSDMRGKYTIEARKWLQAAHRVQATTRRRISPLGVGQDSIQRGHRRLRWASMLEAFRKLLRRREAAANVAKASSARAAKLAGENISSKKSENGNSNGTGADSTSHTSSHSDTPTPEQLSKLKSERDRAIRRAYLAANTGRTHADDKSGNARRNPPQLHMQAQAQGQRLMQMQQRLRRQEQIRRLQRIRQVQHARRIQRQQQQQQQLQRQQQWQLQHQPQQQLSQNKLPSNQGVAVSSSPAARSLPSTASQSPSRRSPTPTPEQILAAGRDHPHSLSSSELASSVSVSPPHQRGFSAAQVAAVVNQIQMRNPGISGSQATRLAVVYMSNYQKRHRRQKQERLLQQRQQQQQQQQQQQLMPQLQSQLQSSSSVATSPVLSPRAQSMSQNGMNSSQLSQTGQNHQIHNQNHTHTHTPTPEEIQKAMSQHRIPQQQLGVNQSLQTITTPVLSSPPTAPVSSASSPIHNTVQMVGQTSPQINTNISRNLLNNDPNLSLEAIENDILNTDFSLLDSEKLNQA